jgi:hypothetical protein
LNALRFAQPLAPFVHGDRHQPRAELGVAAKTIQVAECVDHHFLCGVFRFLFIAEHGQKREIHHPLVRANQLMEKIGFTRDYPGDQFLFLLDRGRHG